MTIIDRRGETSTRDFEYILDERDCAHLLISMMPEEGLTEVKRILRDALTER